MSIRSVLHSSAVVLFISMFLLSTSVAMAEGVEPDSADTAKQCKLAISDERYHIGEVVVVGETKPMPVDSSIYKVKLISEERIKASGSQSLDELLMTEANIRMSTDLVLGAQIEMMGLGAQNVKVMIDGVPIIGRLDGNLDLNQVRLDDIQQIEIIEGPMSVVYGNNAIAGTINLITKRNRHHSLETQVQAYAESVGEYSAAIRANKRLGEKHNLGLNFGGKIFDGVDFDKSTRAKDWKPKREYYADLVYSYKADSWDFDFRSRYYSDRLDYLGNIVQQVKTFNTHYFTDRLNFSATVNKKWSDRSQINIVGAYNYYDRYNQAYTKDLSDLSIVYSDKEKSQTMNMQMLRAIYMYSLIPNKLSFQTGADLNNETMSGPKVKDEKQNMGDFAGFFNLKYLPSSNLSLMPGIRYAYNTGYTTPLVYSLNARWDALKKLSLRGSFAKGFRAPDIKELYMKFVNSSHEIYGNENLEAESSYNYNASIDYKFIHRNSVFTLSSALFYNDIKNMISLIQRAGETAYSYDNIDKYKTSGLNINFDYKYKNIINPYIGYGYTGRYNSYTNVNDGRKFNPTHDFFAGIKATEPNTKIKLVADYKLNGKLPYFYTYSNGDIVEGTQESYDMLNLSLSRQFNNSNINVVLGMKNAFDVKTITRDSASSGSHSGGAGVPIAYGRAFYISLIYRFYK